MRTATWFDDFLASAALFLDPDGTPPDVGTVSTNPALAKTYERIAHLGEKGVLPRSRGRRARPDRLAPGRQPVGEHVWRSGVMKMRDLHLHSPERAPTHVNYRGLDVYSMGPPSSGGSTVGAALNILEGYNLGSMTGRRPTTTISRPRATPSRTCNAYLADPGLLRRATSHGAALGRVRGDPARADPTPTAALGPVPPRDPYPFEGGETTLPI